MATRIHAVRADITQLDVDVIVNAANVTLLGGGGVDGAIHRAAGPALLEECRRMGGCPTGEARITGGYALKARRIIHAVGPVWQGGKRDEPRLLAACYEASLRLAVEHRLRSIAFPAISTGAYAFPIELAATIAIDTTRRFVDQSDRLDEVAFCCFSDEGLAVYRRLLGTQNAHTAIP